LREHGQRAPEDLTFYDRIAAALSEADRIVLLCHGTGESNASRILTERLTKRHPGIYARIVRQADVNTSAMTEAEIVSYARQALTADPQ
jgi:predicted esterase